MIDMTKKVDGTVVRCLLARLNEYARAGDLVTPNSDAASLYEEEGYKRELAERTSYVFSKEQPIVGKRYRKNRFTDGSVVVTVWHADDDGQWLFTKDDKFSLVERPYGGEWSQWGWKSRGEFRAYEHCAKAAGEAELILSEEMK